MVRHLMSAIHSLLKRWREDKGLLFRTARGSLWLGMGSGVEQAMRFVRNMILARLLLPETFGIIAIVLAVNTLFDSLTQVGIREAVVQNPEGGESTFLNGAWWFSAGRGALLYALAFIAAPFISGFYDNVQLTPMLRLAFLSLLFRGMMSANSFILVKKMEFRKWILIEQLGGVIGVMVSVALSYILKNAWGLVIGFTAESLAQLILSYVVSPYLPRLRFAKEHLTPLFSYARGMLGIPIFTFIYLRADIFVLGKMISPAELGLYSMAITLARFPSLIMDKMVSPLLMPSFSEIQKDHPRVNRALIRVTKILAFLFVPLAVFAAIYGRQTLAVIYTREYARVAIPFAILIIADILKDLNTPFTAIYLALGKPIYLRYFTIMRAVLLGLLLYPAIYFFSTTGAACAVLLAMIVSLLFQAWQMRGFIGLSGLRYWSSFLSPLGISISIVVFWGASRLLGSRSDMGDLLIGLAGLAAAYALAALLLARSRLSGKKNE